MKKEYLRGSRQWALESANFVLGCKHDCKYCYSKAMAIDRKDSDKDSWAEAKVKDHRLKAQFKRKHGRVMFPSSHDITPEFIEESMEFLGKLVDAYDEVLVTSKPHFCCVKRICESFAQHRHKILFRFTIGSASDEALKFWEPGAPLFNERLECLKLAYDSGFKTSVSCEPMLDDRIDLVINKVEPFVLDTIWLGKMNYPLQRVKANGADDAQTIYRVKELIKWQSELPIRKLYMRYKDNPKIRFKESIAKAVGGKVEQEW
jgi:DNA repair photolyase